MTFDLMLFSGGALEKHAVSEIIKCNEITLCYGLVLSEQQAMELAQTRTYALKSSGRIEFGGGVIDKLVLNFCDSPYIFQSNYTEVMHELVEIFYYYKNETLDLMSDDELISFMKSCFDGKCQGSLELLKLRELERMARNIRFGYEPDHGDEEDEEGEDDERY